MDQSFVPFLTSPDALPTSATRSDCQQKLQYMKFLKIRAIVFPTIAAVCLILGIFLISYFQNYSHFLLALGYILMTIGLVCLVMSLVILPTFVRLMSGHSATTVYATKHADALTQFHYPRQTTVPMQMTQSPYILNTAMPPFPGSRQTPIGIQDNFLSPSAPPNYEDIMSSPQ